MFPLKDDIPSERFPLVTLILIIANILAFFSELSLGPNVESAILYFGLVPVRYTDPEIRSQFYAVEQALPFFTSMFLHGGWTHLIGNLWILWIFGDNVEDRLGRFRYILLYVGGGIAAALVHVFTNSHSALPTIGASGAVAAIMGSYFRLYPHAHVITIVPPFFLGPTFVIPAVLFLGWWFVLQFFSGSLSLLGNPDRVGGIAWWAHIGGFIFGVLAVAHLKRKPLHQPMPWDRSSGG